MKLIIQRVTKASVSVDNKIISQIENGLFVLVGIKAGDSEKEADQLALKLSKLRVMRDNEGKMNMSVNDVNSEMLVVSQFTLYGDTTGGNRPSFLTAARPEIAEPIYEYFIKKLESLGIKVQTGKFGAEMRIETSLDGPVTIIMES